MQVSALAEALASSRLPDYAISLRKLQLWLSSAGLEELAHAVASLPQRAAPVEQEVRNEPEHAWF